ncbi:NADH-quinone oxidoreductase subunit NuoE, partial [Cellulomonas septica]|nr:NADH-quinone oxidoreductase subunit NuoE [Cellulomonas septica]
AGERPASAAEPTPAGTPAPGAEQSSAERPAVGERDVSPEQEQRKQSSDDAKES